MTWNIHPASYNFYIFQTLDSSPLRILIGILFGFLIFITVIIFSCNGFSSIKFIKFLLISAILLFTIKVTLFFNLINFDYAKYILRSPTMIVSKEIFSVFSEKENIISDIKPTPEYTFNSFLTKREKLPPTIILMIVESWSETENSLNEIKKELTVKRIKIIESGFSTYKGSTLQGEIRELCSKYISLSTNLIHEKSKYKCAPEYLKNIGYDVIGMHGYSGNFYNRNIIWGNLGIEKRIFKKDIINKKYCNGSFSGICDKDLISYGLKFINTHPLKFLYFLTLTSHEPIDKSLLIQKNIYLQNISTKNNTQIISRKAISYLIDGIESKIDGECTEAYIVGDHQAPSILGNKSFPDEKVPFLVLSFNCREDKYHIGP